MSALPKDVVDQLVALLRSGSPLPDEYQAALFPPKKKEPELTYDGKERVEDILADTMAMPLQLVKTFGNTHTKDAWSNRLIFGDNLQAMKALADDPGIRGNVRLVYIDPPFSTKRDLSGPQEQKAYQDKVEGARFIEFLRKRLVLIDDLLAPDGSLYVHLDQRKSHYMKIVLDEIFDPSRFQNEIVWKSADAHSDSKTYSAVHDVIYFYSKAADPAKSFNRQFVELSKSTADKWYRHEDPDGRRYNLDNTSSPNPRPNLMYTFEGVPSPPKGWRYTRERMTELFKAGLLVKTGKTKPTFKLKRYLDESKGTLLTDLWSDVSQIRGYAGANEATGYPTQKPEALLARIVQSSSSPGDIVLDCFAGSGTSLAVAEKLGRRWIGIDCGKLAMYTMQKRLLTLKKEIGNRGSALKPKPFSVYNAGLYDYERLKGLPWEDFRSFALKLFQCRDHPHTVGGIHIDGYFRNRDCLVFNYQRDADVSLDREFVTELGDQLGDKLAKEFFVIAPAARVEFLEDYVDYRGTRFFFLRIPYSIINELHKKEFSALEQPADEGDINAASETVGFDFVEPPTVRAVYARKDGKLSVTIKEFESQHVAPTNGPEGRDALSMVMVDYDYDGQVFDLDGTFFAEDVRAAKWQLAFDANAVGERVMLIYLDIYGNEHREVKKTSDFGSTPRRARVARRG